MMRSFGALALLALAGCAAAPKLADYPRREIDRPFTLPKGLASWSILGEYTQEKYRFFDGSLDTDRSFVGPIPLKWQTSLSDDWNLLWYPIPIAALYSIRNDAAVTSGLLLGYGLKLSSAGYSTAGVGAQYFHRQKFNSDLALEVSPSLMPWFPLGDRAKWDFQAGVEVGPFWQAAETISLRAGARAVLRRDSQTVIRDDAFGSGGLDIEAHESWRTVFPVYAGMNWSFARQWDFGTEVNYQRLGETDDYSRLDVDIEFRHFW